MKRLYVSFFEELLRFDAFASSSSVSSVLLRALHLYVLLSKGASRQIQNSHIGSGIFPPTSRSRRISSLGTMSSVT